MQSLFLLATAFVISPLRPAPSSRANVVALAQLPLPETPVQPPEERQEEGTGWKRTPGGLRFRTLTAGTGVIPAPNSVVSVHYTVSFAQSGDIIGSSRGRPPLTFKLGSTYDVPIFSDAVPGMSVDEAIRVVVPASAIPRSQANNVPKDQEGESVLVDIELKRVESGIATIIPSLLPPGTRRVTIARALFALSFVPYFLPDELKPDAYRFGDPAAISEARSAAANSLWLGGAATPLDALFQ